MLGSYEAEMVGLATGHTVCSRVLHVGGLTTIVNNATATEFVLIRTATHAVNVMASSIIQN